MFSATDALYRSIASVKCNKYASRGDKQSPNDASHIQLPQIDVVAAASSSTTLRLWRRSRRHGTRRLWNHIPKRLRAARITPCDGASHMYYMHLIYRRRQDGQGAMDRWVEGSAFNHGTRI